MVEVQATELEYIDLQANNQKFYRVYQIGTVTTTQYGRIGAFGTFTPRKALPSEEAARGAADKAIAGKVAKGYSVVASGSISFSEDPTDYDLDQEARRLSISEKIPVDTTVHH